MHTVGKQYILVYFPFIYLLQVKDVLTCFNSLSFNIPDSIPAGMRHVEIGMLAPSYEAIVLTG